MMLGIYSVHDNAVGAFMSPFYARSKGEAVRSFTEAANDPKHQFALHAADYTLYCIGVFDDNSGMLKPMDPDRIISATEATIKSIN